MAPVPCLEDLEKNSLQDYLKASTALLMAVDNVLEEPDNAKHRMLTSTHKQLADIILAVNGGRACLTFLGFREENGRFVLPGDAPLDRLKTFRSDLEDHRRSFVNRPLNEIVRQPIIEVEPQPRASSTTSHTYIVGQPRSRGGTGMSVVSVVSPLRHVQVLDDNLFLQKITRQFNQVLQYDNDKVIQKAQELIPIRSLELSAVRRLRMLQAAIKSGNIKAAEMDIKDIILYELMSWFKNCFFEWVDTPSCVVCGGATTRTGTRISEAEQCHVEVYGCDGSCTILTYFPRYNQVEKLLQTRKGRCGEWANCFTFLCVSLGYDARFVMDETDHVWTEVYSHSQKRWIHCDPCENVMDTPLMYESGWGKKLSYVIAYSTEEVQDVTWRYSSNHKEVMKRRTFCTEQELLDLIFSLRKRRQQTLCESRVKYLQSRICLELVELLMPKQPTDFEKRGRTSGSLAWRLMRGEVSTPTPSFTPHVWALTAEEKSAKEIHILYSAAQDKYIRVVTGEETTGWDNGIFFKCNVFRKRESDWNMVYLARTEDSKEGKILWKFDAANSGLVIDLVRIKCNFEVFENGVVTRELCGPGKFVCIPSGSEMFETNELAGYSSLILDVDFSGGVGNVAWQHAQLFRQSANDDSFPLDIQITLK